MNSKSRSKNASVTNSLKDIPAAYDIAAALSECRKKGIVSRKAIAWIEGGRVQVSLDEEFLKTRIDRHMRDEIYNKWCAELKVTFTDPNQHQLSEVADNEPRLARCVAASNGANWSAWKEIDVSEFLLNPPGTPRERRLSIIPLEYTIFDPAMSEAVWMEKPETAPLPRCLEIGWILLSDIARVYCLAVEFIDGFEQEFNSPKESRPWNFATRPAALLRDCKKATLKLIISIALMDCKKPKQNPDAGIALQQGFLIGKKLAQAEGIISNAKDRKLALQQGFTGQHASKFWTWVMKLQTTSQKGKTASELFFGLDGQLDPDFKGKKLQIVENDKLKRGNNEEMSLAAFQTSLSRAKKRAREKVS